MTKRWNCWSNWKTENQRIPRRTPNQRGDSKCENKGNKRNQRKSKPVSFFKGTDEAIGKRKLNKDQDQLLHTKPKYQTNQKGGLYYENKENKRNQRKSKPVSFFKRTNIWVTDEAIGKRKPNQDQDQLLHTKPK
jgi:hypothetical protein